MPPGSLVSTPGLGSGHPPQGKGLAGAEPPGATHTPSQHRVPGVLRTLAQQHLRRSRLHRTRPGRRPCKRGGGVRAWPVTLAKSQWAKLVNWGSSEERPSRQPEGTSWAGTCSREGRDVGTGRRCSQGCHRDGVVHGMISAGGNQAAMDCSSRSGHWSSRVCPERGYLRNQLARLERRSVPWGTGGWRARGSPRGAAAWRGSQSPGPGRSWGSRSPFWKQESPVMPVAAEREQPGSDRCPRPAVPPALVLTLRRWGWVAAAVRPGRCCRRHVLGPVSVPLGRPRPSPWRGTGTPLLQEGGDQGG